MADKTKNCFTVLLFACVFIFTSCGGINGSVPDGSEASDTVVAPFVIADDKPSGSTEYSDDKNADKVRTEPTFTVDKSISESDGTHLSIDVIFGNKTILQRGAVNRLSGETDGTYVAAELDGTLYYGETSGEEWTVYLPARPADEKNYTLTIYTESEKFTLSEVCFGDVFLCSGQSNMETLLGQYEAHAADAENADDEFLRLFTVEKPVSSDKASPLSDTLSGGAWNTADPDSARAFSAVGYLFGRKMRQKLGIPVGLINASVGGSQISYWLPGKEATALEAAGEELFDGEEQKLYPSVGYNGMIYPLRNVNIRGVLWYQGETDAISVHGGYEKALVALISSYRKIFDDENLFWTVMELPRYGSCPVGYADIRSAQQRVTAADGRAALSIDIDTGDWSDIHPGNKTVIAERAADETLFSFYGIDSPRCPELVGGESLADGSLKLYFKNAGDGLEIRNGGAGFELSTENSSVIKSDYTVEACEDGKSVLVKYFDKKIMAVEYGKNPLIEVAARYDVSKQLCIYNSYSLPADQFEFCV